MSVRKSSFDEIGILENAFEIIIKKWLRNNKTVKDRAMGCA